jgi:carbamoyltransferase
LQDGQILAAAQEERFTRKKHAPRFPQHAIQYCLGDAKIAATQLNYVVYYVNPFLTFERLLLSYLTVAPKGLRPS